MLQFKIIPVTPFEENCTVVWCDETGDAAIIDPGGEAEVIQKTVADLGVNVKKILITHGHLDHVGAAQQLADHYKVDIIGSDINDQFLFESLPEQCMQFGFPYVKPFLPTKWLNEGDKIELGHLTFDVLHCPGHTPGHIVFISSADKTAFVGDVLFKNSIGRTDFPRGNYQDLMHSIKQKLLPLGDDITFIPGHGPMSTFGDERKNNPYLV
ncbi:MBL fold metallo-hydrolase [Orbaceae bacterium ESL0721]|nr:MBL fold metallo-hydrolase [Orbaceae bacterium ESL0721]